MLALHFMGARLDAHLIIQLLSLNNDEELDRETEEETEEEIVE